MKKRWRLAAGLLCLSMGLVVGCFPTTEDVNLLADAEREYQAGLHEGTVGVMTEQHSAMTPELAASFAAMRDQYNDLSAQLQNQAGKTKASGVGVGGLGGFEGILGGLLDMAGLGWLFPMFFGKSRADDRLNTLELGLATAAKSGSAVPSDS